MIRWGGFFLSWHLWIFLTFSLLRSFSSGFVWDCRGSPTCMLISADLHSGPHHVVSSSYVANWCVNWILSHTIWTNQTSFLHFATCGLKLWDRDNQTKPTFPFPYIYLKYLTSKEAATERTIPGLSVTLLILDCTDGGRYIKRPQDNIYAWRTSISFWDVLYLEKHTLHCVLNVLYLFLLPLLKP